MISDHFGFVRSQFLIQKIRNVVFEKNHETHSVSYPVLRLEEGNYYLAIFINHFKSDELMHGAIKRPDQWALADIHNGDVLKIIDCHSDDFIDAPFDQTLHFDQEKITPSQIYYERMFAMLDQVREELCNEQRFNTEVYGQYLEKLIANVTDDFAPYYHALSNIES